MEIVLYFGTLFLMFVAAFIVAVAFGAKALDRLFDYTPETEEKEDPSLHAR